MPEIVSGFNVGAPVPVDNRMTRKTIAERDSIPEGVRYEGMEVYCSETGVKYQLFGGTTNDCWKPIVSSGEGTGMRVGGCTWFTDVDKVVNAKGEDCGTLKDCMTEEFSGTWFYAIRSNSDNGVSSYPSEYTIDGANGFLSLRDYVIWTGDRLVHIPTFEAKASTIKNADGKYSPKSGVDGLMSSTDKAYLGDLLAHWDKKYIPVYNSPTEVDVGWTNGYLVNWVRATGWYLGGFGKDCGGHPPVVNDNHTSWILLVLVGKVKDGVFPHALQVAFDLSNNLIYTRKGWLDGNSAVSSWADTWTKVGDIPDRSITVDKLSNDIVEGLLLFADEISELSKKAHTHDNKSEIDKIQKGDVESWNSKTEIAVKVRGKVNGVVESDDENYNGKALDMVDVEVGDAFIVSAEVELWNGELTAKVGDLLVSVGNNASYVGNWMVFSGREAVKAIEDVLSYKADLDSNGRLKGEQLPVDVVTRTGGYFDANGNIPVVSGASKIKDSGVNINNISNALKGNASGAVVALRDVSPVEHEVGCVVRSKNLIPNSYEVASGTTKNGVTLTVLNDGSISLNGTTTAGTVLWLVSASKLGLKNGKTYTLSFISSSDTTNMSAQVIGSPSLIKEAEAGVNKSKTFTLQSPGGAFQIWIGTGVSFNDDVLKFQIEEGTEATPWTPYVALESVTLSKYRKNLCPTTSLAVSGSTVSKNNSITSIYLSPGKYTAQAKFKQTGAKTGVGINIRKVIRKEDGNISTFEPLTNVVGSSAISGSLSVTAEVPECGEYSIQLFANMTSNVLESDAVCEYTYIQLEEGPVATEFEEYVEPVKYIPNADGTIEGVTSIAPNMTFMTDTPNTYVDVTYNRDINKAFEEMYNAIISLGGNI